MKERHSFGGTIGFVLAAAGSAVGLGNIWRFPYLAAKDGGGIFLVVYIIVAITFGFALLTSEVAIGRKTKQSPLTAYGYLNKKAKPLGYIACLVPMIILPYYCAIGGWVLKYLVVYITGNGMSAAEDGYFTGFISSQLSPIVYMVIFLLATMVVILLGVNKGIEALSKFIMPALVILVLIISVFSLTLKYDDGTGLRTGLQGLKIYTIPNFDGMTFSSFLTVVVDAMGQLFYSLSVAMGIMIAYGSYVHNDANLVGSINKIEIFDTLIAFLAGVMIIPSVYVFMGREGMAASGPGLIFVSLPKIFASMGSIGNFVGILFFAMVLFAALTSSVSIYEAVVSSFIDGVGTNRKKSTIIEGIIALAFGVLVCLGYNRCYFELKLPNGSVGQILDLMDYISNSILMPIGAIGTCIVIGWVIKPKAIIDEITRNGESFKRKKLYIVMVKYIAPLLLLFLLLKSLGIFS